MPDPLTGAPRGADGHLGGGVPEARAQGITYWLWLYLLYLLTTESSNSPRSKTASTTP